MAKSRKAKRQKVPRLQLEDLPNELVIGTFSYLNMKDLNNCSQVSKRFRAIVNDEQGRRKEDLLKIIQDFQCFKCKRVPGPIEAKGRDTGERPVHKGQIISECPYEIIVYPKIATKKFPRFLSLEVYYFKVTPKQSLSSCK